jgi:hypothetical protein
MAMATKISKAAKSAALALVRGVDEEDRPAIFYVDRHVTTEWQGYAGYVEVVSHTLRTDDDALAMQADDGIPARAIRPDRRGNWTRRRGKPTRRVNDDNADTWQEHT